MINPVPPQASFFEKSKTKITNATYMMVTSLKLLAANPVAIVFPIISATIISLLTYIWMNKMYSKYGVHIFDKGLKHIFSGQLSPNEKEALAYVAILSLLFLVFVVGFIGKIVRTVVYTGLSHYIGKILENEKSSLIQSFLTGFSRIFAATFWAIISTIIKIVVSNLQNKKNKGIITALLANILGDFIKVGWHMLTFFLVPVLAFESLGLFDSIKKSAQLMQKTFGESAVAMVGFSTISGIIKSTTFICISIIFGLLALNAYVGIAIGIIVTIFVSAVVKTTKVIFKTASYNLATGKRTGPFKVNDLKNSFSK